MEITKIVITGGPCAGKSSAMEYLDEELSRIGYKVIFVAETATELMSGGVSPLSCGSSADYQKLQMKLQLEKEKIFEQAAKTMNFDKVLIVCDRGTLDCKAYMEEADFKSAIEDIGKSEVELRDNYDAVFHLVTAAKGALHAYTTENNSVRTETPKMASQLDDKLISAWTGHPHFRVIDNSTDFEDKKKRLVAEITAFLGEPEPYEIERKFLIEYPNLEWLDSNPTCKKVKIIQTYLKNNGQEEVRIRQRGENGSYVFFETKKSAISGMKRSEIERRISENEYICALMEADTTMRQIKKTRYCLTYQNQYFEIDIYPFWDDKAILEIELRDENTEIVFPPEIKIIKEVTEDPKYKNSALAKIE